MGFYPGFERPTCLATPQISERTKQSLCGWLYIYVYIEMIDYSESDCTIEIYESWINQTLKSNSVA